MVIVGVLIAAWIPASVLLALGLGRAVSIAERRRSYPQPRQSMFDRAA